MIDLIKKLISGIRKCCVFLFWPQKTDKNRYHTVEVLEPSVIFEAKDGKYGEDGSESLSDYEGPAKTPSSSSFSNSLGDLKKNIEYIIGMERLSGNIDTPTPQDIARILNVPVEAVEAAMREME